MFLEIKMNENVFENVQILLEKLGLSFWKW